MTKEEADLEEYKGNYVVYEETPEGKGYRRIIASPLPIDIYELDAIKALVNAKQIVIAAGGGGIPVLEQGAKLKGASAIIEKDYTAAKLADLLDASTLIFLTSRDQLTIKNSDQAETPLDKIKTSELSHLINEGHFEKVTTLPKVQAALNFVNKGENRRSIITKLDHAKEGIHERTGTIISN